MNKRIGKQMIKDDINDIKCNDISTYINDIDCNIQINREEKCMTSKVKKASSFIFGLMLVMVMTFSLSTVSVASVRVYERTEDNLMVNSRINLTQSRIDDILDTPKVNATEKVYDFADLFDDSDESDLYSEITSFIAKSNMDMVVVTIDENNKYDQVAYADDFYDYNDFGVGTTCDGLILLIDMDNRQIHIGTTGQAIVMYDDSRIDSLLDDIYYWVSDEFYLEGAEAFVESATSFYNQGTPSSNSNAYIDEDGNYYGGSYSGEDEAFDQYLMMAFIGALAITIIFIGMKLYDARKPSIAKTAKFYIVNGSLKISERVDRFLNTHTTRVKIEAPSSSGGSSFHSGGSGISHGGGSRGF